MFVQFNFGEGSASATTIKIESAAPMALPTATSHNLGGTPKVADCTGWCQQLRSYLHSTFVVDSCNTKLASIDMHLLWYEYQSSKEWTDNLHVWVWLPGGATAVLVKANAGCADRTVSQRHDRHQLQLLQEHAGLSAQSKCCTQCGCEKGAQRMYILKLHIVEGFLLEAPKEWAVRC